MRNHVRAAVGIILMMNFMAAMANATTLDITTTDFTPGGEIKSGSFITMASEIETWANGNVGTDNIPDSGITSAMLAANSVNATHLQTDIAFVVVGTVTAYAGDTQTDTLTQAGWLVCNGSAVSRTTYASLYGLVGTRYGTGDGITTFNLPDLRARMVVGANATVISADAGDTEDTRSVRTVGDTGGVESHTLSVGELAAHNHLLQSQNAVGGALLLPDYGSVNASAGTMDATAVTNTGNNYAHQNMPPYIVLNYIIYAGRP